MRDFALTIIIFALLPVCVLRPWVGVLVWSWIGFMNPHKLAWGFAKGMPFALLVGSAVLIGLLGTKEKKAVPFDAAIVLLALLFLHFTLTTLFAWVPSVAWDQWSKVAKILVFSAITVSLIYGKRKIDLLMLVIALSIGFYGVKGAIFSVATGGQYKVFGPEASFIGGNTSIGLAMLMVLPLMPALARQFDHPWAKRGLPIAALLNVVAIVFTYSRGALLGLAAVAPLVYLKSGKKILLVLLLVPALAAIPSKLVDRVETIETYEQDTSALLRLQAWDVAWNVALERPLTGAGFDFEYIDDATWLSYTDRRVEDARNYARAAHSIYFQVLGQHGFVGLGLFLALMLLTLRHLRRTAKAAQGQPKLEWVADYANALLFGLIGYLVAGAFLSLAYFDLTYMYVALAVILRREVRVAATVQEESATRGLDFRRSAGVS